MFMARPNQPWLRHLVWGSAFGYLGALKKANDCLKNNNKKIPTQHEKAQLCLIVQYSWGCVNKCRFTFNTADSPKPGVGEVALLGFGLSLGLIWGGIGTVADVRPRIQPVVRADGDSHQAEGSESPHGG